MYRKLRGLTQAQLAEKSGVAAISIHQYESDKRQPRLEQICAIAAALNIPVVKLMDFPEESLHTIPQSQMEDMISGVDQLIYDSNKSDLISAFDLLNNNGQEKAVESVRKIAAIPKYQKQENKIAEEKPQAEAQGDKNVSESDTE